MYWSVVVVVVENATKPSRFARFWQGPQSLAPATRNDIWTSKSGPYMVCFVRFDLGMCFAPRRRALFRYLNFQKWSDAEVFCAFWLRNVLRATTACTFSTSQLPKVVRRWGVLYILTWKCASRHNGVQFFISHLASWLRTRRFSEPAFRPSGGPKSLENPVFRDFPTFSRICIFFLLTLSLLLFFLLIFLFSLPLPFSAFHLSHIVGSLTSKLPSQTLLHTEPFTPQTLLHTDAFTHRTFYTQKLLHTDTFTHRRFYTQKLLHTDALHKDAFTKEAFTHRTFLSSKSFLV